ncbi:MAG TPA: DUF1697 domain-containing protein [Verrucomicrobiae bacterium]|nr:DUF1697 domain-containing protein [Verrucomicrobiae bacterium]
MAQYVALLRGIGPLNPNMRNEKIRAVFEGLGLVDVQTVLATGNVLFESNRRDTAQLESDIEAALQPQLGFHSTTVVRTRQQMQSLLLTHPFESMLYSKKTNLNVTFLKKAASTRWQFPYKNPDKTYTVLAMQDMAVFSVVDLTGAKTPDLMVRLEKEFGKDITTRSWNTVQKIIKKWEG